MSNNDFIFRIWLDLLSSDKKIKVDKVRVSGGLVGYRVLEDNSSNFMTTIGYNDIAKIFTTVQNSKSEKHYYIYNYASTPDLVQQCIDTIRDGLKELEEERRKYKEFEHLIDEGLAKAQKKCEVKYNCCIYDVYEVGKSYTLFGRDFICVAIDSGLAFFAEKSKEMDNSVEVSFNDMLVLDINKSPIRPVFNSDYPKEVK